MTINLVFIFYLAHHAEYVRNLLEHLWLQISQSTTTSLYCGI